MPRRCSTDVRPGGTIPVPGRRKRHDLLDAAFLGGTAAHGIELDDGYRVGSAHCGCTVVPAALSVGYQRGDQRHATDRGGGRRLRGRDLPRARLRARPAPARLPSDQRGRPVRRRGRGGEAARPRRAADRRRARHRGERRRRPVRLRQRRRRHQAAARRPCLARRDPGRIAGRARRAGPAQRDRGARRLHAGLRVRPLRQGPADRVAARRAVRHHRLLHQALCVLPPHPARRRGAVRPDERREDRRRRDQPRRRRDLSHRRRARAYRLGRLCVARN